MKCLCATLNARVGPHVCLHVWRAEPEEDDEYAVEDLEVAGRRLATCLPLGHPLVSPMSLSYFSLLFCWVPSMEPFSPPSSAGGAAAQADCGAWADLGECENNPEYMLDRCAEVRG